MTCARRFRPSARRARAARQQGFSLVELLVTVVIMAEILIGLLILFDSSSRLARAQTHLASLQQSLRVGQAEVVRFARMAGTGGLPITRLNLPAGEPDAVNPDYDLLGAFPRGGYAVSVYNNVPEGTIVEVVDPTVAAADAGDDDVLPGSDVLTLRGVFTTPLYYIDPPLDISNWVTAGLDDQAVTLAERVRLSSKEWWDYPQDISVLAESLSAALAANRAEALILRDTLNPNAYVIMELDLDTPPAGLTPVTCPSIPAGADFEPQCITFWLRLDPSATPGEEYADLSTGTSLLPGGGGQTLTIDVATGEQIELPTSIGSIGMLEEYRFFVRAEWEVPDDTSTRIAPLLSRARFLPGTNTQVNRVDIADNIIDLQIAVGVDTDVAGSGAGYGQIFEDGSATDEVLFNTIADLDGTTSYQPPPNGATWYDPVLEFHFLRINTLVQTRFGDANHQAPVLMAIEDYNRGNSFTVAGKTYNFNSQAENELNYRRRWLQTVVELRNLQ